MKCEMVLKGILRKSHPHQNIFSILTTKIQKEKKESENKILHMNIVLKNADFIKIIVSNS